jgi:hypothetical protein
VVLVSGIAKPQEGEAPKARFIAKPYRAHELTEAVGGVIRQAG